MTELLGEGDDQVLHAIGKPRKHCNKHDDCDAEDASRSEQGRPRAYHCWAEDCEECFGC